MPIMPVSAVAGRRCEIVRAAYQGDVGFQSNTDAPQSIVRYDNGDQAVVLTGDIKTARPPQDGETPGARMAREQTEAGIVNEPGREQQLKSNPRGDRLIVEDHLDKDGLRTDGPTLDEFVKAGYDAKFYPPSGYADKRTADEKEAAAKAAEVGKAAADKKAAEKTDADKAAADGAGQTG